MSEAIYYTLNWKVHTLINGNDRVAYVISRTRDDTNEMQIWGQVPFGGVGFTDGTFADGKKFKSQDKAKAKMHGLIWLQRDETWMEVTHDE